MPEERPAVLLERARGGSSEALGALLSQCGERVLSLIRLRLGPRLRARVESRDILQATLLKALTRFDGFEGRETGPLLAWLARIAENEIRDQADFHGRQRRDAGRQVPIDEAPPAALVERARSMTSRIALGERMALLERALETLPADQREVIVLRRLADLSFPEIAPRLGRSPDACRMLFARAMTALTLAMSATA
jgi:RNA polymerase sigma-70 factor (ECF subfamily)